MISTLFILVLAASPGALAATFDVSVGTVGGTAALRYDPQTVTAAPGDIVNFVFHPKNHTATQSSFNSPCVPLSGGFDTGFVPVAADTANLRTISFTVKDSNPVWFHCEQTNHCSMGMVFAINPPPDSSSNSFAAFQARAMGSSASATTTGFVTPPPPSAATVTATVTFGSSTYTTTYLSYDGTPPPTPTAVPIDHKITVGNNGQLVYSPANISASIGDTVTFEFHPKNHTVTQSSFSAPCQPLVNASTSQRIGFDSNFRFVLPNATTFQTFQIKINDTAPIWGYCRQTGHCGSGMVFAINAVESGPNNFAAFQALAKRINGTSAASASATASATATSGAVSSSSRISCAAFAGLLLFILMYTF